MLRYRIQKKIYTSTSQTIKSNPSNTIIMEFYNRYIAVTVAELTREDDGEAVMSYKNYNILAHRKSISVLRPGKGLAHPALIDWNSLPQRFKDKWVAKYGNPNDLMKASDEELQYSPRGY